MTATGSIVIGVLAIQGAFIEHIYLLKEAVKALQLSGEPVTVIEVRTREHLEKCSGLVIPGGESTAISLVAERTGMLGPLRDFIHDTNKAVWGTCAGLILVANQASGARKGGQELFGGLDVRVNRNHFGSQVDSFTTSLEIPALKDLGDQTKGNGFQCVFIRAPVIEAINISSGNPTIYLDTTAVKTEKGAIASAPISDEWAKIQQENQVQALATLPGSMTKTGNEICVAVRQGRILGTSFHPELTEDSRIHQWWIKKCVLQL